MQKADVKDQYTVLKYKESVTKQMTKSKNIAEKYELEQTPISINGKRLELYRVKNIDPIINDLVNNGEECINNFPFWVKVWES